MLIIDMPMPKEKYVDVRIFADGTATVSTDEKPYYKEMSVGELVTCGECKYKPYWCVGADPNDRTGFDIEFPQYKEPNRCPCQCEDGWYAWIPDNDWFCGHGKRKEQTDETD